MQSKVKDKAVADEQLELTVLDPSRMRTFKGVSGLAVSDHVLRGAIEVNKALACLERMEGGAETETYQHLKSCASALVALEDQINPTHTVRL